MNSYQHLLISWSNFKKNNMKKNLFYLSALIYILSTGTLYAQQPDNQPQADEVGYIVKVGDMAPDFTITLTDGKSVKLSSLRGKIVMLQFTASWCGVCRKEMPHIEKDIWLKHKNNDNFALIGIDRDEPLEKVIKFGKSTGITYPLGLDPGADIFAKYALRNAGITRNVLIDRDGRILMLTRLFNEDEFNSLVKKIDELIMN